MYVLPNTNYIHMCVSHACCISIVPFMWLLIIELSKLLVTVCVCEEPLSTVNTCFMR